MKKGQKYFDTDFDCIVTYICGPEDPEYKEYIQLEKESDAKRKEREKDFWRIKNELQIRDLEQP